MKLKHHLSESLRFVDAPSPWPRMFLSALSVTLPLIIGVIRDDPQSSIYGSLLGFILVLNDHFGPFKKRILHLVASFVFLAAAFLTGILIAGSFWMIFPVLFIMAFSIGQSKGLGLELERLLLFCTFQLLNGALTPGLEEKIPKLLIYAFISFGCYLGSLYLVFLLLRHNSNFQRSKRQLLLEAFRQKASVRYALTLASVSCLGLLISHYLEFGRGQWLVGTILIVMMPSRVMSFQKSFQRVFGTFLGLSISSGLISFTKSPFILISYSAVAAFLAPLGLIKNYWLANVFIASLIMFLLDFGATAQTEEEISFALMRFIDITLGSLIGTLGTFIAFKKGK